MNNRFSYTSKSTVYNHKRSKVKWIAIAGVALLLVIIVVISLVLPALTLTNLVCDIEEHIHNDKCFKEIEMYSCSAHAHSKECYDENESLVCGYENFYIHKHNDDCYNENILICPLLETEIHSHTDECYNGMLSEASNDEAVLVCNKKETMLHNHSDDCYDVQNNLICGMNELVEHVHSDTCNTVKTTVLICGKEEHRHSDGCYDNVVKSVDNDSKWLVCTSAEHTHTLTCYAGNCGDKTHNHVDSCYTLICTEDHEHDLSCYKTGGYLECSLPAHTHSHECYAYDISFNMKSSGAPESEVTLNDVELLQRTTTEIEKSNITVVGVTSSDTSFVYDDSGILKTTQTPSVYTITYKIEVKDNLGNVTLYRDFTYSTYVKVPSELSADEVGDVAYITSAVIPKDSKGYNGLGVFSGLAPFDTKDTTHIPGNDIGDNDVYLRSFDSATYTIEISNAVRDTSEFSYYKSATVGFEFIIPGVTMKQAYFMEESMGWLYTKTNENNFKQYEIPGYGVVLSGTFLWEGNSNEGTYAIGAGVQDLTAVIQVLNMIEGQTLTPKFSFWFECNEDIGTPSENYVVTDHDKVETAVPPELIISSAPRYNITLFAPSSFEQVTGTFDFNEGNPDIAPNYGLGEVRGRLCGFGIRVMVISKGNGYGLKGCEFPNGEDIKLQFELSTSYTYVNSDGETVTEVLPEDFRPLVWSIEGNMSSNKAGNRSIPYGTYDHIGTIPYNKIYHEDNAYKSCYNGGDWTGTQSDSGSGASYKNTIDITVSDYEINLDHNPYANSDNSRGIYNYYNPETTSLSQYTYFNFSAGEIFVVFPYYSHKGKEYLPDYVNESKETYGSGQINVIASEVMCEVPSQSRTATDSDQILLDDDKRVLGYPLSRPGTFNQTARYLKYEYEHYIDPLIDGCHVNGKDWLTLGDNVAIGSTFNQSGADDLNSFCAVTQFLKFDSDFFIPQDARSDPFRGLFGTAGPPVYGPEVLNHLYVGKKGGWDHKGASPSGEGYDDEMFAATPDMKGLVYYNSLENLWADGYECVGILYEHRGVYYSDTRLRNQIRGITNANAEADSVYATCVYSEMWSKSVVSDEEARTLYGVESPLEMTDSNWKHYAHNCIPTRMDKAVDKDTNVEYNTYELRKAPDRIFPSEESVYKKSVYENGTFVGEIYQEWADSCLAVSYFAKVDKLLLQDDSTGNTKTYYDLDINQYEVDYSLDLSVDFNYRLEDSSSQGNEHFITLVVEDILEKGLEYIPYSAYYDGEYTSSGEGKRGTVTGGKQIEPEVEYLSNGNTKLTWRINTSFTAIDNINNIDLPDIYYSCAINPSVDKNTQLTNKVNVYVEGNFIPQFTDGLENYSEATISVIKNYSASTSKVALNPVVKQNDVLNCLISLSNNGSNTKEIMAIDALPYNGDLGGSAYHGTLSVSGICINDYADNVDWCQGVSLYYTTNESYKGVVSTELTKNDVLVSEDWIKLTLSDNGEFLITDEFAPVAIVIIGEIPENKTYSITLKMNLSDAQPGDYIVNQLSNEKTIVNARFFVAKRILRGLTWFDVNLDGLQDNDELRIDGICVTLYKQCSDGTYEPFVLENGTIAKINTGEQMDIKTGVITNYNDDGKGGGYQFVNMPEGVFAVTFTDGITDISDMTATVSNVGMTGSDDLLDDIDSDGIPTYIGTTNSERKLEKTTIEGIVMPTIEELGPYTFISSHNDSGFHSAFDGIIRLNKTDTNGNNLGGAVFNIYRLSCSEPQCSHEYNDCWNKITETPLVSDYNGAIGREGYYEGTYKVVEESAPHGFKKLTVPIVFTVDSKHCELLTNSEFVSLNLSEGVAEISIANEPGTELPSTGSLGVEIYLISGGLILIIAAVGLVLVYRKKRIVV